MSTRSNEERAAARRRARLAARGELTEEELDAAEAADEPAPARGGFLQRLFPPAPPLPNKPDPLAGFDRDGPLRPVRERLFLLRRNPAAWIVTGILGFVGYVATPFYAGSVLELVGTFVLFGSLIAAGWFGWQRPALYGTAAALVGALLRIVFVVVAFAVEDVPPDTFSSSSLVIGEALQLAYQAGLGFIGGWYGGYLRRRQTQLNTETKRRR